MLIMRDFITDQRLHKALDEIESWLGYVVPAFPMPLEIQKKSLCRMRLNKETRLYELLFIKEESQNQATYCHELAHLVIWLNGAVTRYDFLDPIPMALCHQTPYIRHFLETIWEYMQHVPTFELVKDLGYDEGPSYAPVITDLIKLIRQGQLFPVIDAISFDPQQDQIRCQASALVQGLALPMAEETRCALRKIAAERLPQSLELADAILAALGPRSLLGPQEYLEYLLEIYHIAGLPRADLRPSFVDKTDPSFRSRILAVAKL